MGGLLIARFPLAIAILLLHPELHHCDCCESARRGDAARNQDCSCQADWTHGVLPRRGWRLLTSATAPSILSAFTALSFLLFSMQPGGRWSWTSLSADIETLGVTSVAGFRWTG